MYPSNQRRRRSAVFTKLFAAAFGLILLGACGAENGVSVAVPTTAAEAPTATGATIEPAPTTKRDGTHSPMAAEQAEPTTDPTPTALQVAAAETVLPRAPIGFDELMQSLPPAGPRPISIEIEAIGVRDAEVISVGVNPDDLSFEVPPAEQVGWYGFGPAPGEAGSAVLAAHIAYNGVDGVFRYLEDVEIGSIVIIGFDDGSTQEYRIDQVTEYVKQELPDSLFARDGREQLALITCGGSFNYQLDSYDSNTVAIAVPV